MSNKRYPHLMFSEKIVSLHSKARSFDIMQNKAEYRTSLVSKSLPIAKRLSAIYSFPIAKTIRCVSPHVLAVDGNGAVHWCGQEDALMLFATNKTSGRSVSERNGTSFTFTCIQDEPTSYIENMEEI